MIEKGATFNVLDKGEIILIDHMGSDADICNAARISYGKGTKSVSDDTNLIRYLMRHYHTTPFEMCELKLCVKVPMDTWRQWIRHRMASVNEYSTRYSKAIDEKQETNPNEWRLQSTTNKQGSTSYLTSWPDDNDNKTPMNIGEYLSNREENFHEHANNIYQERLNLGIAKEQARKDLPLSTYTKAFWKIDLHNLLHFLRLRMDEHAQLEIRSYANIIGNEIVSQLWPITWQAFQDYRLQAILLTRLDKQVIQFINRNCTVDGEEMGLSVFMNSIFSNKRESEECLSKLKQLGFCKNESDFI